MLVIGEAIVPVFGAIKAASFNLLLLLLLLISGDDSVWVSDFKVSDVVVLEMIFVRVVADVVDTGRFKLTLLLLLLLECVVAPVSNGGKFEYFELLELFLNNIGRGNDSFEFETIVLIGNLIFEEEEFINCGVFVDCCCCGKLNLIDEFKDIFESIDSCDDTDIFEFVLSFNKCGCGCFCVLVFTIFDRPISFSETESGVDVDCVTSVILNFK